MGRRRERHGDGHGHVSDELREPNDLSRQHRERLISLKADALRRTVTEDGPRCAGFPVPRGDTSEREEMPILIPFNSNLVELQLSRFQKTHAKDIHRYIKL